VYEKHNYKRYIGLYGHIGVGTGHRHGFNIKKLPMGMKVAAVATLCQDERVFAAMLAAGTPCPVDGKIGERAREEWQTRGVLASVKKEDVGYYAINPPKIDLSDSSKRIGPAVNACDAYKGDDPVIRDRVCGK
jgi:hypothetical protein